MDMQIDATIPNECILREAMVKFDWHLLLLLLVIIAPLKADPDHKILQMAYLTQTPAAVILPHLCLSPYYLHIEADASEIRGKYNCTTSRQCPSGLEDSSTGWSIC